MKPKHLTLALLNLLAVSLASCTLEEIEIPQDELYLREFIKEFGLFDSNHTWCAATQMYVTVNPTSTIEELKVYSLTDDKYYYVAHMSDVSSPATITFDAPAGTTDLKIKADGVTYYTTVGSTVEIGGSASRTVYTSSSQFTVAESTTPFYFSTALPGTILTANTPWYLIYNGIEYISYNITPTNVYGYLKEGNTNNRNSSLILMDCMFKSPASGSLTVYPIFWNSSQEHTLGIYYYPDNDTSQDIVHLDIYKDQDYGSDCQLYYETQAGLGEYTYINETLCKYTSTMPYTYSSYVSNFADWTSYSEQYMSTATWYIVSTSFFNVNMYSKGITVTPSNSDLKFGFYIALSDYRLDSDGNIVSGAPTGSDDVVRLYSQSQLNVTPELKTSTMSSKGLTTDRDWEDYMETEEFVRAFTYACEMWHPITNDLFFLFEDTYNDSSNDDLNDLLLVIQGANYANMYYYGKDEDDDETYKWLICAEDLGNVGDFDFNDMIVQVSVDPDNSQAGTYTCVKFTALAAGGMLPLYLHYDINQIYTEDSSLSSDITSDGLLQITATSGKTYTEWHSWFGYNASYVMINTGNGPETSGPGYTCTLYVKGDFSLTSDTNTYSVVGETSSLSYFYITSKSKTGTNNVMTPTTTGSTSAPQMFVIRDLGYDGNGWCWPEENASITDVFPASGGAPGFVGWAQDHTVYYWHLYVPATGAYKRPWE